MESIYIPFKINSTYAPCNSHPKDVVHQNDRKKQMVSPKLFPSNLKFHIAHTKFSYIA